MAFLVLDSGEVFEGRRVGAPGDALGELVFTTGMEGYLETLSDESFAGQIVIQTFPLIGNYGFIPEDLEGESALRGYVVQDLCEAPSNFRAAGNVASYLIERGIPGIAGVDTRALTRIIRERGVCNALICDEVPADLGFVKAYAVKDAVASVTCKAPYVVQAEGEEKHRVTLVDYGAKRSISRSLAARGCRVRVVPASSSAEEILGDDTEGVMLSNGPGDPAENVFAIGQIRRLLGRVPVFGICLGHQLTALAAGYRTVKLKYGHRGGNVPVQDRVTGQSFITSQNHGYAVVPEGGEGGVERYVCLNDGSTEGMDYPALRAFTVQFHPEAASGPRDTAFLFDRFCAMMEEDHAKG
ncbi:MAG: glutamine-hydrolyzing carbamoyl-phosphate synthase small subunit [Clostridia bacterium]|nr:glutamine-hydrolyzing carbamoyl-phosphate synthase small subunit [Clostridia bacterium]